MSARGDSKQQREFLQLVHSAEHPALKCIKLDCLLAKGFTRCVNRTIPSVRRPPLHHCVRHLTDDHITVIEMLLPIADLSLVDRKGRSVFAYLIPVRGAQAAIFFLLLDHVRDLATQWMILRSAMSARSVLEVQLWERFRLTGLYLQLHCDSEESDASVSES